MKTRITIFLLTYLLLVNTLPAQQTANYLFCKAASFYQTDQTEEEQGLLQQFGYYPKKTKINPDSSLYYYHNYINNYPYHYLTPYAYYDMAYILFKEKKEPREAEKYINKVLRFKSVAHTRIDNGKKRYSVNLDTIMTERYKARKLLVEILLQEHDYKKLSHEFTLLEKELTRDQKNFPGKNAIASEHYFIDTCKVNYYEHVDSLNKALEVLYSEEKFYELHSFNKLIELLIKKYGLPATKKSLKKALDGATISTNEMILQIDLLQGKKLYLNNSLYTCKENHSSGEQPEDINCLRKKTILNKVLN